MHSGTRKILWSGVEWQKTKVFNVLVLVLVVEVVFSHAREDWKWEYYIQQDAGLIIKVKLRTIFSKTLPHESLNNVTYDFSYLVMQWPTSFCSANGSRFPTISLCTACDHRIILRTDLKVLTAKTHPSEAQTISTLQY